MAFSEETVRAAWERSRHWCECRRPGHFHDSRHCPHMLFWERRGKGDAAGSWEPHHLHHPEDDSLANCEILCTHCGSQIR